MLKEVLVVEGKMDVVAIDKAVDADCIITGGFALHKKTLDDIEKAYKRTSRCAGNSLARRSASALRMPRPF